MTAHWRKIGAVTGVFVAVAALTVVIVLLRGHDLTTPGTSNPGNPGTMQPSGLAPTPGMFGAPRSGMRYVPMQVRPVPGVCNEPAIPVGGTPPPCG
jgi:hypothetical protein